MTETTTLNQVYHLMVEAMKQIVVEQGITTRITMEDLFDYYIFTLILITCTLSFSLVPESFSRLLLLW
jgi:hypothetical protein